MVGRTLSVRLGFGLPISGSWATGENMLTIATRAEQLGYDSLWTFQRLLHPLDAEWGSMYHAVHDPLIALAHVAAVTQRIRLGVAVVNAPFYAPLLLAKQLTTLDEVSAGRLDVGLGLGWANQEFAAVGAPMEHRGARTAEFVRCLKAIWDDDERGFDGRFFQVPPARIEPKPRQRPHPPLLLGGTAQPALRRVGRIADGWVSSSRQNLDTIAKDIAVIAASAEQADRDPSQLRYIVRGVIGLGERVQGGDRRALHGSADQIRDDLDRLGQAGVTEVFLDLNFDPQVTADGADPEESMAKAEGVLQAMRPL